MAKRALKDGEQSFDVTVLEAAEPARVVLFAVGGGGNPERHLPLLEALAADGCTVVAPHFERITALPPPSEATLLMRARRLRQALDAFARPGLPVAGVGHSIGTTMLLALAGGQAWTFAGDRLAIARDERIDHLALFAPATDFFRVQGALDAVRTPIVAWAGTKDLVTPVAQAKFLARELEGKAAIEVRVVEGANHFSFMHSLPPQTEDPLPHRERFLASLTAEVSSFLAT